MISEAIGFFWLPTPCVAPDSSSLIFSEALGLFGLANPCVTSQSSSLMTSETLGSLGLRIHASPLTGVPW
jgi:hypothetical protein